MWSLSILTISLHPYTSTGRIGSGPMGGKVIVVPSSQRVYVPCVAWLKIDLEEHNITISIENKRRRDQKASVALQSNDLKALRWEAWPPPEPCMTHGMEPEEEMGWLPWVPVVQAHRVKDACHHYPTAKCCSLKASLWLKLGWATDDTGTPACSSSPEISSGLLVTQRPELITIKKVENQEASIETIEVTRV